MEYGLPESVNISGENFKIRYDFRVILDIFEALNDPDLDDQERIIAILTMFYPDFEKIPDYEEATRELYKFINGGKESDGGKKHTKLVDWQQDYPLIIAPINRVVGEEVRKIPYDMESNTGGFHWWSFLSAYQEIGDCLFAQVVRIRDKKAKNEKMSKEDREFYRKNRDIIDIQQKYSESEEALIAELLGRKTNGEN